MEEADWTDLVKKYIGSKNERMSEARDTDGTRKAQKLRCGHHAGGGGVEHQYGGARAHYVRVPNSNNEGREPAVRDQKAEVAATGDNTYSAGDQREGGSRNQPRTRTRDEDGNEEETTA